MAAAYIEQFFDCKSMLRTLYLHVYWIHNLYHTKVWKRCLLNCRGVWLNWERLKWIHKVRAHFFLVSQLALTLTYQGLCGEIERLRLDFLSAVRNGDGNKQKILFRRLQQCMLRAREVGNTKLEISAQLLDIVSIAVVFCRIDKLSCDFVYKSSKYVQEVKCVNTHTHTLTLVWGLHTKVDTES